MLKTKVNQKSSNRNEKCSTVFQKSSNGNEKCSNVENPPFYFINNLKNLCNKDIMNFGNGRIKRLN